MSADEHRDLSREGLSRLMFGVALHELKSAVEILEGGDEPSDEELDDAVLLCADATAMLEALRAGRLETPGEPASSMDDGKESEGHDG